MEKITAILIFSILMLEGCTKEDPKEHLQKGVEYFNKGEYDKAVLELKTSSQSDKKLAETYYYLALLDEKNRQYKAMSENLKKVIELSPNHVDARLKFGKVQLLLGQLDIALEQAEAVLKEASQNLDAQLLKASVLMKQKNQKEAQAIVDDVLKVNPNYADGLVLKSLIYMQKDNFNDALSLINAAIKQDQKNISLRLFKIQLDAKNKNINAVISDYQELVNLFPDNQEFKITLAKIYAQSDKKKEAEDLLRGLINAKPNDVNLKLILLDFLKASYPERVNDELQSLTKQYQENSKALLTLATWMTTHQGFNEAKSLLNRVIELDEDKNHVLSAKMLLAKIAFALKDLDDSKKIIGEILSDNSNYIDAKILQAKVLFTQAQYGEAIDILTKVLWDQPNSEEALVLLGQSFLSKGDQKEADKQFSKVLIVNPANLQAVTYIYNNALVVKNVDYAQEVVEKALAYQPENLLLLEKLAILHLSINKLDSAKELVRRIEKNNSPQAKTLAQYLQARIYQEQGECVKAIDLYKELAASVFRNYEILANMARCHEKINKKDGMIAFLNDLMANNSQNIAAGMVLSDLLVSDKQFDKSTALLTNLINENKKAPELFSALAKVKLTQGDANAAIAVYEEGLKQNPDNIKLSLALAALYHEQNNYPSAISIYETLLKNNPNLDVAINNLAAILTEHDSDKGNLEKAIRLSEKLKNSIQPYYKDTYAWALIKQGEVGAGIDLLNQIINSEPEVPVFRYHLGVAHYKNANDGSAIAELRQALELAAKQGGFSDQKAAEALLNEIVAKTNQ